MNFMFQKGCEIASRYTSPLIAACRFFDKTVDSGLGSFIVLNEDGWLMTAAHNFGIPLAFNQHKAEIAAYQSKVDEINRDGDKDDQQKRELVNNLQRNDKWITDSLLWLGADGVQDLETYIYGEHDIAFIRIDKKFLGAGRTYPKIKNPDNFKMGASLCKYGYPFYPIQATFDEHQRRFSFPENLMPIPAFPIEGIYTRNLMQGKTQDGTMDIIYLETSSPGLKGQSGGPIFDVDGNIYAVVSKNLTMALGFKGEVEINGTKVEENQFINVGIGVHAKTLVDLMKKHGIKFEMVD